MLLLIIELVVFIGIALLLLNHFWGKKVK